MPIERHCRSISFSKSYVRPDVPWMCLHHMRVGAQKLVAISVRGGEKKLTVTPNNETQVFVSY